ncbi:MAG: TerB family tellurite resistance protein [Myxococcaceae bacterium]|nr:TerB family tellurite resistance protein [Myxococcaceae bacterium]
MSNDSLADRGKELEEAFFRQANQKLTEKLQAENKKKLDKEAISKLTGISSGELLDKLVELNLGASTVAAFGLLPVVEVAWADGRIDDKEKQAVLDASRQAGLTGTAAEIVEHWLKDQPAKNIFETWKQYIAAIAVRLGPDEKTLMKNEMLGRARAVAEASGGFLGLGNHVSKEEQAVLDKIAAAFG